MTKGQGKGNSRTRSYRAGALSAEDFPIADVSEHLADDDTVVWVDLLEPGEEQLRELAGELGLHELAVEDALSPHQRPKLDHYATHEFLSCHAVRVDAGAGDLEKTEIDVFIGDRWLITVRDRASFFDMDAVLERWDRTPDMAAHGVGYLLYGLLDVVVDGYFTVVQSFDEYYDEVSDLIFDDHPLDPGQQRNWFRMRRSLVRFHRLVVPLREAISALMRRDQTAVAEDLFPYYQDVYDHLLRVGESTDSLRDLVSTIVETNLSLRDYRQNQAMKQVTSWAAIIAVPTLVTGWYGMNVPYPGSGETWGVVASAGLIAVTSGGLYFSFRRRDWL